MNDTEPKMIWIDFNALVASPLRSTVAARVTVLDEHESQVYVQHRNNPPLWVNRDRVLEQP